jgi:hypothetical protein
VSRDATDTIEFQEKEVVMPNNDLLREKIHQFIRRREMQYPQPAKLLKHAENHSKESHPQEIDSGPFIMTD